MPCRELPRILCRAGQERHGNLSYQLETERAEGSLPAPLVPVLFHLCSLDCFRGRKQWKKISKDWNGASRHRQVFTEGPRLWKTHVPQPGANDSLFHAGLALLSLAEGQQYSQSYRVVREQLELRHACWVEEDQLGKSPAFCWICKEGAGSLCLAFTPRSVWKPVTVT